MNPEEIAPILNETISLKEFIYRALKDGFNISEIMEILESERSVNKDSLKTVINAITSELNKIWDDDSIANYHNRDERLKWYFGPKDYHIFWNSYKIRLIEKEFSQQNIENIDNATSKIVSFLKAPGISRFNCRGIVLGYVQSGKTANFLGVISKAADMGYKLFIILSGISNSLRNQTKSRIQKDIYDKNEEHWYFLTPDDEDFNIKKILPINDYLERNWEKKFLCIMKKNSIRLESFITWIGDNKEKFDDIPVILIDDECDQASLNTNTDEERTEINKNIIKILGLFQKITYIGYTATPYANLLVSPKNHIDLYPRDFISALPKPFDYIGSEEIFGSNEIITDEDGYELDNTFPIIEDFIPEGELDLLYPTTEIFNPKKIPDSLKKAIIYFWLATTFMWWRKGNKIVNYTKSHSTMLIHTHQETDTHVILRDNIQEFKDEILRKLKDENRRDDLIEKIREIWIYEKKKMDNCTYPGIVEVWPEFDCIFTSNLLRTTIEESIIVMQNSREDNVDNVDDLFLLYQNNQGNCYIAIGGNMLSRGLTLEGLIVSYYVRTAENYDTILQMGRWFGFRKNYLDLIRLWTTQDIYQHFLHIADVETEIREQIEENGHQHLNPSQFPIKIETHDDLLPTSKDKIRDVVYLYSNYGGKIISTSFFYRTNEEWLEHNIKAVNNLISKILDDGIEEKKIRSNYLFKGVKNNIIIDFLNEYKVHLESRNFVKQSIVQYIQEENIVWNVNLLSKTTNVEGSPTITIAEKFIINLFSRSRIPSNNNEDINIRALYSKVDLFDDLELTKEQFYEYFETRNKNKIPKERISEVRKEILGKTGLILIYPIDKDSKPERETLKFPLEAVKHILGISIYFPVSEGDEGKNYIQVRIDKE